MTCAAFSTWTTIACALLAPARARGTVMPRMWPNPSHTGQTTLVSESPSSKLLALDEWDHTMSILGVPKIRTPPHVGCILVDGTALGFRMRHTSCTHWYTLSLVTMHLWNRWWRTLSHHILHWGQCCCTPSRSHSRVLA